MGFFGAGDPELNRLSKEIKQLGGKIREIERELRRHQEAQLSLHQSFIAHAPESIARSLQSFIDSMPTQFSQHLSQLSIANTRNLKEELRAFCTSAALRASIKTVMDQDRNWEHAGGSAWSVERGRGLLVARETSTVREPFFLEIRAVMRPVETICSKYSVGLGSAIRESPAFGALPPDLKNIGKNYAEASSKVVALTSQLRQFEQEMELRERDYETRKVWKQA